MGAYRDEVVGVFVRFRAPLQSDEKLLPTSVLRVQKYEEIRVYFRRTFILK
jgi:hypothetical protein